MQIIFWMGLAVLIIAVLMAFAPDGYEDETGFHLGKKGQ